MLLTAGQTEIIKSTVPVVKQHGSTITHTFYENLLRDVPELNNVFNQANQITGRQAAALAGAVYTYAAHITDLEALTPAIERIAHKHTSLHVQPAQYDVFGTYLLAAMKQVLGDALTPEILDAWQAAYKQLADLMISRESRLYSMSGDWLDWRDFRILDKVAESSDIVSFYLAPANGAPLPPYSPGQYVSVRIKAPGDTFFHTRQFSLSEAPRRDRYRISVKRDGGLNLQNPTAPPHPGHVTNALFDHHNIGDVLQVSHPRGDYVVEAEKQDAKPPVVLISAGVGSAPNLSILEALVHEDPAQRISWVHVARTAKSNPFGPHIRNIARTHPSVQTHTFLKRPTPEDREGADFDYLEQMDLSLLNSEHDLFVRDQTAMYYICGPEGFIAEMAGSLRDMGVASDRIKMEFFDPNILPVP